MYRLLVCFRPVVLVVVQGEMIALTYVLDDANEMKITKV